jgi:hypothetical protein
MVSIFGLFGRRKDNTPGYDIADTYRDLRSQVLTIDPAKMGLQRTGSNQAWGVLMEIGYPPTRDFPLPKEGNIRFYFLTFDCILTVEANEDDLGGNRLPLSPLYSKAHEVITRARLVDEQLSAVEKNIEED